MGLHKNITIDDVHIPYSFEYDNEANRTSATGFVNSDIGKFARQTNNNSIWMLTSTAPTWIEITSTSSSVITNKVDLICIKATPGTIGFGQAVYAVGFDDLNQAIKVELAQANSSTTTPALGISTSQFTNILTGNVRNIGLLGEFNTINFSLHSKLYLSETTAGALRIGDANGPNKSEFIAEVLKVDAVHGIIIINTSLLSGASDASPQSIGNFNTPGVSSSISRDDHIHNLPFNTIQTVLSGATGSIGVNNKNIINILDPIGAQDASTKHYTDNLIQTLSTKESVDVVSINNISSLSGLSSTIDGVNINSDGQRILLVGQANQVQNGIWLSHSGAWTRPLDFNIGQHASGIVVFVKFGITYTASGWVCTTATSSDVINTNNITFNRFTGAGGLISGNGIDISTNTITAVAHPEGSISVVSGGMKVGVLATDAEHGNRGGGAIHSTAIANGAAGFLSGSDKSKLDGIQSGAQVVNFSNVASALGGAAASNANYVFKSDGYGSGSMGLNSLNISNTVTVGLSGDVQFNSIAEAILYAQARGATPSNIFLIQVYPGTYFEPPMILDDGIAISGGNGGIASGVTIIAANPLEDLFTTNGSILFGLNIAGVSDPSKALVRLTGLSMSGDPAQMAISNCGFTAAPTCIIAEPGTTLTILQCGISVSNFGEEIGIGIKIDGAFLELSQFLFNVSASVLPFYDFNPIQTGIYVTNNSTAVLTSVVFSIPGVDNTPSALLVDNGSVVSVFSSQFIENANAITIGSSGNNTIVNVQGTMFLSNILNQNILSSTGAIFEVVSSDHVAYNVVSGGVLSGIEQVANIATTEIVGTAALRYSSNRLADLSDFLLQFGNTGLVTGGAVSAATGLSVDVSSGSGWIKRFGPNLDIQGVTWEDTSGISLTANTTNFILYSDTDNAIIAQVSSPGVSDIELAQVVTDGYGIKFLHSTSVSINSTHDNFAQYLLNTRKFRLKQGLVLHQGSTATKISVTSGSYYRATESISYAGSTNSTFSYFYGSSGATEVPGQTNLDITNYDNAGVLSTLSDGYFRVDTAYLTSDGRISIIYGSEQYSQENSANLDEGVSAFNTISETAFLLATIVVQKSVGIVTVVDRRIIDGSTGGSGGSGGVTDHGSLLGLLDDDHPQYFLTAGTRSMSGNLNMGGNLITNVSTVSGVVVNSHASRHNPGGADALAVGVPPSIQVGASPSQGTAASYALSDHQHGISAGASSTTVGASNAGGSASTVSRSDHIHAHGSQTDQTNHAVATVSLAGFMSAADKVIVNAAITTTSHPTLKDLIHFLSDGGPGNGFTSNAYREILPSASPFPTSVIWYVDNVKDKKIIEKLIVRNTNKTPSSVTYNLYASDGTTIVHSAADTITYNGIFETSRTRVIS